MTYHDDHIVPDQDELYRIEQEEMERAALACDQYEFEMAVTSTPLIIRARDLLAKTELMIHRNQLRLIETEKVLREPSSNTWKSYERA